jgi:hypothetical protein
VTRQLSTSFQAKFSKKRFRAICQCFQTDTLDSLFVSSIAALIKHCPPISDIRGIQMDLARWCVAGVKEKTLPAFMTTSLFEK